MPRRAGTIMVTIGLSPHSRRVMQLQAQAAEQGQSLSVYVKGLLLALGSEGRVVPLRFGEASAVLASLEQEANSLEMELVDYLRALLSDRHRAFYGGKGPTSLWYPRVQLLEAADAEERRAAIDEIDLGEAMKTVEQLVGFYDEIGNFS